MDEALLRAVTREVLDRLAKPRALLLGRAPKELFGWQPVRAGAHDAVLIGSLGAHELLHFPDETVCAALLAGKPVYLCREGLDYHRFAQSADRGFYAQLLSAERRLWAMGVRPFSARCAQKSAILANMTQKDSEEMQ